MNVPLVISVFWNPVWFVNRNVLLNTTSDYNFRLQLVVTYEKES